MRHTALEAARVSIKGGVQCGYPSGGDVGHVAMVQGGRCHHADTGVAMVVVVVLEERGEDLAGMLHAGEAGEEVRGVLAYLVVLNRLSL